MDWIKKHTDQFALALTALVLVGLSVLIFLKTQSFGEGFSAAMASPAHSKEVAKIPTTEIDNAQKSLTEPGQWAEKSEDKSLFTALKFVNKDGSLKKAGEGDTTDGRRRIPKGWLQKYDLEFLSPSVLDDDPDTDGFTNFDEFIGPDLSHDNEEDSTNPKDKNSHPPYYVKLFLKQWIKIPFLVTFQAWDGDPKKPQDMTFQINAISRASKTEFLKLGEKVANSPFRLEKYEEKKQVNPKTGEEEDVSELSIRNTETNEVVVLVLGKRTDSPDSFALFTYYLPEIAKPKEIRVKKLQEFVLQPEIQQKYKLIDIKEDGAVIQLPGSDKTYNVPTVKKAQSLQKGP